MKQNKSEMLLFILQGVYNIMCTVTNTIIICVLWSVKLRVSSEKNVNLEALHTAVNKFYSINKTYW